MAILKIARMGHPVLRRPADEVADPTAPEIGALVASMVETMVDAEGLGLAAPQVHVPRRVVVFHTPRRGEEETEDDWSGLTVLINPTVEPLGDEREEGWEGCLSKWPPCRAAAGRCWAQRPALCPSAAHP